MSSFIEGNAALAEKRMSEKAKANEYDRIKAEQDAAQYKADLANAYKGGELNSLAKVSSGFVTPPMEDTRAYIGKLDGSMSQEDYIANKLAAQSKMQAPASTGEVYGSPSAFSGM